VKHTIVIGTVFLVVMALAPMTHAQSYEGSAMKMSSSGSRHSSLKHERIQACADKSAGDPCSYIRKGESVDGTCKSARHAKLFCVASAAGSTGGMMSGGPATGSEHGAATGGETGGSMGGPSGGSMNAPSGGAVGGNNEAPPAGGEAPPPASAP
jgi:hypothetical protein